MIMSIRECLVLRGSVKEACKARLRCKSSPMFAVGETLLDLGAIVMMMGEGCYVKCKTS